MSKLAPRRLAQFDPEQNCYRIPLRYGRVALIDEQDYPIVAGRVCTWTPGRGITVKLDGGQQIIARVIVDAQPGQRVMYRDDDKTNLRRSNLIVVDTQPEASFSARKQPNRQCSSIFKGVSLDRARNLWKAYIRARNNLIDLGRHASELAAAHAYDRGARQYHGRTARLNFPDTDHAWTNPAVRAFHSD